MTVRRPTHQVPTVAPVAPPHRIQPAPGGYHVVAPGGHKVFMPAGTERMPAIPSTFHVGRVGVHGPAHAGVAPGAAAAPGMDLSAPAQFAPDAQYVSDEAKATFGLNQGLAQNDLQGQQRQSALDEAMRRLSAQQPVDQQNATQSANRQGLFYSGHLGQQLGNLATQYAQRRSDAQAQFAQGEQARLAARAALQEGYSADDAAAYAAAVDRQIARDSSAADAGALVAPNSVANPVQVAAGELHSGRHPGRHSARPASPPAPAHATGGSVASNTLAPFSSVHVAAGKRRKPRMTAYGRPMSRG